MSAAFARSAARRSKRWTRADREGRIEYDAGGNVVQCAYDPAGQRESATLASGVSSAFGYDLNGRMTSLSHVGPGGGGPVELLFDAEYGYDAVGNRTFTRLLPRVERSERYGYDP